MAVSDKYLPQEQCIQLYKVYELQAKPKTQTDDPAQWPRNQPQLSCGDKT